MDTARNRILTSPATVNWHMLASALDDYQSIGYQYVEVPWLVSEKAVRHTFNGDVYPTVQDRFFVGSAEQSFIELELMNKLSKGKFVTMSPCFRDEPNLSTYTQLHFMKIELYRNDDGINEDSVNAMVIDALRVMEQLVRQRHLSLFKVVETEEGKDILLDGVEVGSYGIREVNGLKWVYGTGLAEPRFTTVIRRIESQERMKCNL